MTRLYTVMEKGVMLDSTFIPHDMNIPAFRDFIKYVKEHGSKSYTTPVEYTPDYKDLRRERYPSVEDQLDMMYWDKINLTNKWHDTITEIKKQFPKTVTSVPVKKPIPQWFRDILENKVTYI